MTFPFLIDAEASIRNDGPIALCIRNKIFLMAVVAFSFLSAPPAGAQQSLSAKEPAPSTESIPQPSRLVGVGSCTAAGCHGGGHPNQIVGSEYNVWIAQDPHARAYSTLFDQRSQRMVQLLDGLPLGTAAAAHKDARCLACHSMTGAEPNETRRDVLSDGVGCEACHGPAEKWLAVHFEHRLTTPERDQLGMWNTDSLLARTQVCVRCHVGSPGRDVNHDLIAAGHPRLQFEMSAYLNALPKHWDESQDRENRGADFDASLWAIGQACGSQAALEQLAHRADQSKAWPEFAEWSCSACHHDLRDDLPRQKRLADAGGLKGLSVAWDTWNHHTMRLHAADVSRAFEVPADPAVRIESDLNVVDKQMRQLNPDRVQVAEVARGAAGELGRFAAAIEKSHIKGPSVDWLTHSILKAQRDSDTTDWSIAAQTYDALASLHETRLRQAAIVAQRPANDPLTRAMKQLFDDLAEYEISPSNYFSKRDDVQTQLGELSKLVPTSEVNP